MRTLILMAWLAACCTAQPGSGESAEIPALGPSYELTAQERAAIIAQQQGVIDSLKRAGVFSRHAALGKTQTTRFAWPIAFDTGNGVFGCHSITNFFDHDTSAGLLDYAGGTRTYNGHKGTDFWIYPFPWWQMDSMKVRIVAAAPGVITGIREGNDDRSCASGSAQWNAVYLRHTDGTIAWYGHMKKGSVTAKSVGDAVAAGEYLGTVGSSGSSTGPHLHFEVHDSLNKPVDPFAGPYNPTTALSWWQSQRPMTDRGVNRIITCSTLPVIPACPGQESPNAKRNFQPGDSVTCMFYLRNATSDRKISYRLRQPDSTVWRSGEYTPAVAIYVAMYRSWRNLLPANAMQGRWALEADYDSLSYRYFFTVGSVGVRSIRHYRVTPDAGPSPATALDIRGRRMNGAADVRGVVVWASAGRFHSQIRK